jgi:hypothetical protein
MSGCDILNRIESEVRTWLLDLRRLYRYLRFREYLAYTAEARMRPHAGALIRFPARREGEGYSGRVSSVLPRGFGNGKYYYQVWVRDRALIRRGTESSTSNYE